MNIFQAVKVNFRKATLNIKIFHIKEKWLSVVNCECEKEKELLEEVVKDGFYLQEDFVTQQEEETLITEISRSFRRTKYEYGHWDGVIEGYREVEKSNWSAECQVILDKMKRVVFSQQDRQQPYVHVLDLAKNGYIKPHVDSVKFCGSKISGLSLLSSAVMRFVSTSQPTSYIDVLLPRFSLYIMRDRLRYDFTHEVLSDEHSYWKGQHVPRDRRFAILIRNQ